MRKVLITGWAGFIGSNLTRYWLENYKDDQIYGVDSMTYAARPKWVFDYIKENQGVEKKFTNVILDISNQDQTKFVLKSIKPDLVIHLAAESHVCRSIETPRKFLNSNVVGTYNLLESLHEIWNGDISKRLHVVSTDEVYGELSIDDPKDLFHEERSFAPRSPYAASKASADLLALAFHETYAMNLSISHCSNNYGPNQDFEKLIPKTIQSILKNECVELYGDGCQVRDWLYVDDHCSAIDQIIHNGSNGQKYCVGGDNEMQNKQVVNFIYSALEDVLEIDIERKIIFANKRPTDDKRYGIDFTKLTKHTGWTPSNSFYENLTKTIHWYIENNQVEKKLL